LVAAIAIWWCGPRHAPVDMLLLSSVGKRASPPAAA